ncbi:MAG: hypothetical protein ABT05_02435 [Lautropia sp. SCN 66-9]|nr:MAG: hypothetical protein ABT05_02435 [Lautropia sp. SCN 66-9]
MATARRQRGLSLLGLLVVGAILVLGALLFMKVLPSVIEYRAISAAVAKIGTAGTSNAREVQSAFDRYAAIDDITSISGKDLLIQKDNDGGAVVSFAYEKRIPLFGPASLVIDYRGNSKGR